MSYFQTAQVIAAQQAAILLGATSEEEAEESALVFDGGVPELEERLFQLLAQLAAVPVIQPHESRAWQYIPREAGLLEALNLLEEAAGLVREMLAAPEFDEDLFGDALPYLRAMSLQ